MTGRFYYCTVGGSLTWAHCGSHATLFKEIQNATLVSSLS